MIRPDGANFSDVAGARIMNRKNSHPKTYELQVVIELDEDGKYVAWCPALEACYTQGDTFEEAMKNIQDVVTMCLEELREERKKVELRFPEVIGIKQVKVTV
jgi:predicted RNase H-like HicB family nuclease